MIMGQGHCLSLNSGKSDTARPGAGEWWEDGLGPGDPNLGLRTHFRPLPATQNSQAQMAPACGAEGGHALGGGVRALSRQWTGTCSGSDGHSTEQMDREKWAGRTEAPSLGEPVVQPGASAPDTAPPAPPVPLIQDLGATPRPSSHGTQAGNLLLQGDSPGPAAPRPSWTVLV